jgi:hypothetical protein
MHNHNIISLYLCFNSHSCCMYLHVYEANLTSLGVLGFIHGTKQEQAQFHPSITYIPTHAKCNVL